MASNLARAMSRDEIYCTINSQVERKWRDFTLQKGHIYGYSPELKRDGLTGLFVVYQVMDDHIVVYAARMTRDRYVWKPYVVEYGNDTAARIKTVNKARRGGVEVVSHKYDFREHYDPKIVTQPFIPMPSMRIPMGVRSTVLHTDRVRVPSEKTGGRSAEELREKREARRMEITLQQARNNARR